MGAEAVLALMDAKADTEPIVVSLVGNTTVRYDLLHGGIRMLDTAC